MKKWMIMCFFGIITIGIFLFFTPVFILLFGLCCVLFGLIAMFRPSQVRSKRVQKIARIRGMGVGFCILGIATSILGGSLAKDFYQGDSSKNIASNFSFQDAPKSNGSDVSRPETEEEQPESNQESSTQKSTNPTNTSTTESPTTTTDPSSVQQPTTTTPTEPTTTTQPSDSHPGKGQGLGRDRKKP